MSHDRNSERNRCSRNEWFDSEALREEAVLFDRNAEDFDAFRQNTGCCRRRSSYCCPMRNNWCCWNRFDMDEAIF